MRTLKSEKPRRPIAQPLPSWEHELKWRQCLVHRNRCLTLQEDNICLHKRVALKATAAGAAMATSSSLEEEFGLVMLTERVKRAQWKRDSREPCMFSHHRFFACGRRCHGSDRDAIWGLNLHTPIFSQHVCKNTELSAKKCTRAHSHCIFVRVSSQKTLAHGNLAWQPVQVQCTSRNDNSTHDPFVRLLL